MRRLGVAILAVLPFVLATCSGSPKSASNETTQGTPSGGTPAQTTQTPPRKPKLLVTKLPAGVEGVELAETGLRVLKGYEFVKESDSTFAVARMSDGRNVTQGGCGCQTTGGCSPVSKGGIIVCEADNCTDCGLALTIGGVRTVIFRY